MAGNETGPGTKKRLELSELVNLTVTYHSESIELKGPDCYPQY